MTEYEKLVRHRLIDLEMSQTQLAKIVHDKTGLYCDQSLIARTMAKAGTNRIKTAMNEVLGFAKDTI